MSQEKNRGRSKSEEKRRLIIDAAGDLFMEQGYENASMDGIAKLAGVSKQTLYSHFGGKEQLFSAAIECKCEEYQLDSSLSNTDNNYRDSLQEFCEQLARLLVSPEALQVFRVCVAEADRTEVGNLFWQAGPERIRNQLHVFLSKQCQLGNLVIPNIDQACSQLIAMLHGEAHACALLGMPCDESNRDLSNYSRACVDMFLCRYEA